MKYRFFRLGMDGSYAEVGSFEATGAPVVFDALIQRNFARSVLPGDRLVGGSTVYERNDFGTWDSIASGPAGEGIISAMEE